MVQQCFDGAWHIWKKAMQPFVRGFFCDCEFRYYLLCVCAYRNSPRRASPHWSAVIRGSECLGSFVVTDPDVRFCQVIVLHSYHVSKSFFLCCHFRMRENPLLLSAIFLMILFLDQTMMEPFEESFRWRFQLPEYTFHTEHFCVHAWFFVQR